MDRNGDVPSELNKLAEAVIGAAIEVHRWLGAGFAELTYQRALRIELEGRGHTVETERPVELRYKDEVIGRGKIDMLIDGKLIVELKAAEPNAKRYRRQVSAYLKATGLTLGLVINFDVDTLKDGLARVVNT